MKNNKRILFYLVMAVFMLVATQARAAVLPNDPLFAEQWYLRSARFPEAWEYTKGSDQVIIAILDSGVDEDHPDLIFKLWRNAGEVPGDGLDNDQNGYVDDIHGWDFLANVPSPNPKTRFTNGRLSEAVHHGTVVAGIAGAKTNNNTGVSGAAWLSPIMALRVLDEDGVGDEYRLAEAIDYAVKNGATVINFSFIGDNISPELKQAIARAHLAGVVIVASAGNEDGLDLDQEVRYPICYDGETAEDNWIIGVTALNENDERYSRANVGADCIDLAAPGVNFSSLAVHSPRYALNDYYHHFKWSGTSMAAPLVAGAAALIKAVAPSLTPAEITRVLKLTATNLEQKNPSDVGKLGAGKLDAVAAVEEAINLMIAKDSVVNNVFNETSQAGATSVFNDSPTTGSNVAPSPNVVPSLSEQNRPSMSESITALLISPDESLKQPLVKVFDHGVEIAVFIPRLQFVQPLAIGVGDFDGAGVVQVVVAGINESGHTVLYFYTLSGEPLRVVTLASAGLDPSSLTVNDDDQNGQADIIFIRRVALASQKLIFNSQGVELYSRP